MDNLGEIIIYQTEDGLTKLEVKMENDTVWLTQAQLVELYQSSKANVSEHIAHIFEEGELSKEAVVRKFRTTASDGKKYNVLYYNMDKHQGMIIDLIFKKYDGRIKLNNPIVCGDNGIPELLREILQKTNGIQETMIHPKTGEQIEIGWIVYSYDEMIRATNYYRNEYGLSGTVFSDDGAGNPYYILDDKIYEYDPIDNESYLKAKTLIDFFT